MSDSPGPDINASKDPTNAPDTNAQPDAAATLFTHAVRVHAFRRTLTEESDRGCALMAGAFLDAELEGLLQRYLVPNQNVQERVFEFNGPLGTFSSRIDMSYLLGLISAPTQRDLHLIRKIRNAFGHQPRPLFFKDPPVIHQCRELSWCGDEVKDDPRAKFCRNVLGCTAAIHGALFHIEPLKEREHTTIPKERWERQKSVIDAISRLLDSDTTTISPEQFLAEVFRRSESAPPDGPATTASGS